MQYRSCKRKHYVITEAFKHTHFITYIIMNPKIISMLCVAALLAPVALPTGAYGRSKAVAAEQTPAGQVITVTGKVLDEQGQPLPGAGIVVKGTTTGTSADIDGNYSLRVGANQTLVVSFIGYKDQEVAVNGRASINVALQSDANYLDETVVVGYGTIKRANLTGAVDVVTSKQFENRVAANLDQMLSGAMPNVYVATMDGAPYRNSSNTSGYAIRGRMNTLAASSAAGDWMGALVLIDGTEGDPSSLNPNDVESVSVLKDAAASAIYGSRGAYGVVLITTKNPVKDEKVTVTYSGNFSYMVPTAIPDLMTDGEEYMYIKANANMNYQNRSRTLSNIWPAATNPFTILEGYQDAAKQAQVVGGVYVKPDGSYEYYGGTDWFDEIYKDNTTSQVHNLSVSGNNGKVSYLISGRYYDYKGIYVGTSDPYQTYNLRSKVNINITDWLTFGENVEYTHDKIHYGITTDGDGTQSPQTRIVTAFGSPTWPVYNPDGTFTKAGAYILGGLVGDAYDPYVADKKGKTRLTENFKTTTSLNAKFFDDTFRIRADYTWHKKDLSTETKKTGVYFSNGQDANGDAIMSFSQSQANLPRQRMEMEITNTRWSAANFIAEYENKFDKHWVKGMVGYNYEVRELDTRAYRKYGLSYWDATAGNAWNFATGTLGTNTSQTGYLSYNGFTDKRWRNAGAFFRVNYSYDDRYLVEINGRYDGSSVFVNDYQWGFFPSASAAWRVSQEPWWNVDPRYVSSLKARVSWGEMGDSMSAGAYNTEDTFKAGTTNRVINGNASSKTYTIPSTSNSNYTWSTIRTFNVGFDAAFLNDRLGITYDYFIKRNLDMLTPGTTHADTYGQSDQFGNNADMSTYGWELSLRFNQPFMLAGKPARVGVTAGIGNNWSIVDRYEGNESKVLSFAGKNSFTYYEGMRMGKIWGFRSNGLFQTTDDLKSYNVVNDDYWQRRQEKAGLGDIWIRDLDGDGDINVGDQTLAKHGDLDIVADLWSRYPFNFSIDLGWGNWYLNAKFQGILHQDFIAYGGFFALSAYGRGNGPLPKWFSGKYWTEDNKGAEFPALAQGNRLFGNSQGNDFYTRHAKFPIDRYVYDAGYLNLKNLQIGYNIPQSILKKAKLSAATVYFTGENIWNWSPFYKHFGRDYDVTTVVYGGADASDGLQWSDQGFGFQYPTLRTFSLGINITY